MVLGTSAWVSGAAPELLGKRPLVFVPEIVLVLLCSAQMSQVGCAARGASMLGAELGLGTSEVRVGWLCAESQ